MFYLKCLTDDDEVEDLIKREIDAREWFVYVDSENARRSKWVQTEREYIESTGKQRVYVINIEDADKLLAITISRIMKSMKVFLSYSPKDLPLVVRIKKALLDRDVRVYSHEILNNGNVDKRRTITGIMEASENGAVMVLVTRASVESSMVAKEVEVAFVENALIIPVVVGDAKLKGASLAYDLLGRAAIRLEELPTDEEINQIVDQFLDRVTEQFNR